MRSSLLAYAFVLMAFVLPGRTVQAAVTMEELDKRILACDVVLKNILAMPDAGIPSDLLRRCRGLAIFPGVVKVGAVIGVTFGSGIILRRDENTGKWSKPVFFTIRGGSLGVQVGAQSIDLILLIMSEQGVQRLLEEQITLGADASVAAGPVGREASAETNPKFDTGILSYSRSKGLFAGISLTGASLQPDKAANEVYHGKGVTVQDVLYGEEGAMTEAAQALLKELDARTP